MASFQKVIERSHSQVTSLKASVNNIFQAVSAHRFRDVAPEIRALVIEGIAHWTKSLPADFLQDQFLKYVAWALSDRVCGLLVAVQQEECAVSSRPKLHFDSLVKRLSIEC